MQQQHKFVFTIEMKNNPGLISVQFISAIQTNNDTSMCLHYNWNEKESRRDLVQLISACLLYTSDAADER